MKITQRHQPRRWTRNAICIALAAPLTVIPLLSIFGLDFRFGTDLYNHASAHGWTTPSGITRTTIITTAQSVNWWVFVPGAAASCLLLLGLSICLAGIAASGSLRWSRITQNAPVWLLAALLPWTVLLVALHLWFDWTDQWTLDGVVVSGLGAFFAPITLTLFTGGSQLFRRRKRLIRARMQFMCRSCGYELRGIRSRRCPECGWVRRFLLVIGLRPTG